MLGSSRGGGGGFGGGFRSQHQQGQDGSSGGGKKTPKRKPRKPKMRVACTAEVVVPEFQRGLIIGKGGSTVKEICRRTSTRVNVPGRDRPASHRVTIQAGDVPDCLHAVWELATLGIGRDGPAETMIRLADGSSFELALTPQSDNGHEPFLIGTLSGGGAMTAYGILSRGPSVDEIDAFVDNERFARPEISAACHVKAFDPSKPDEADLIVFVYGEAATN